MRADWWQYLGAKSARIFMSPAIAEPADDFAPWGDGVATLAQFQVRLNNVPWLID